MIYKGLVAISCVGAIFAGCVSNRAYRDRDSRPWPHEESSHSFVSGAQLDQYEPFNGANSAHRFDLSYIEFDEKGDYWDRRQLGWTLQEIKRVAQIEDLVLLVYVHGWQNDASTLRGHDVGKFHCLLEHLADADEGNHRFFGVYIGWRGKSVPGGDGIFPSKSIPDLISKAIFFVPHELSLYDRKSAAARVAGMPVTEAIFQSVAAARNEAKRYNHVARTILVGHSFGALVLEKAMSEALAAKVISEGDTFTPPADFAVLLNSAADSIYAKEMIDMFRRRQPHGLSTDGGKIGPERPLLVSITSKADFATGRLFPIGTGLSNAFAILREYEWDTRYGQSSHNVSQREYFTKTPGHNGQLISHDAQVVEGEARKPNYEESDSCRAEMLTAFKRSLEEPLLGPQKEIRFVTFAPTGEKTVWELKSRLPDHRLQTPYWVVSVPKEIIRDHSDIFNENSIALMARLFRVVTAAPPPTMQLLDAGESDRSTHRVEQGR